MAIEQVRITDDGVHKELVIDGDGIPTFTREQFDYLNGLDDPALWTAGVTTIMVLSPEVSFDEALGLLGEAMG